MAETPVRYEKVIGELPETLSPSTYYQVRIGEGFDLYLSDSTGSVAHKLNSEGSSNVDGGSASSVFLPSQLIDGGGASG